MARHFVVFAIVFFAIVGIASATAHGPSISPESSASLAPATNNGGKSLAPGTDDGVIGPIDGSTGSDFGAAPIGGPVSEGTFSTPAEAPNSASTTLEASTVAGFILSAFVGSFFF